MIKIDLTSEQRNIISYLMCEFLRKYKIIYCIEQLINLLEKKQCKETANTLRGKIKDYKIFLLNNKASINETIEMFDKAISKDSESKKNIIKIINWGQTEETKDETIIKNRISGFMDFYKKFSDSDQAYEILDILGVNVCPYCNRQYTFTVRKNDKNRDNKSRPQFDHFFPKCEYPYLAISIYNLVPSCGLCNQGKSNTSPEKYLYPYEESFEDKGLHFEIFNVVGNLLKQEQISLKLEPENTHEKLIKQYNDSFKIELLYNKHSDYILELLYKNYVFNDDAIENIYNSYKNLFNDPSELKRLIFGNYESENFNQRPLSKITKDILKQFNRK